MNQRTLTIKGENDPFLERLIDQLPNPKRLEAWRLVQNEKYSMLKALERVGVLILQPA